LRASIRGGLKKAGQKKKRASWRMGKRKGRPGGNGNRLKTRKSENAAVSSKKTKKIGTP